ncbi:hypothetical protein SAMD00019534_040230 [Acytostelium subglobosum LB1]|uniref:hypothetical protein n=1 Tax=Acytostelium subglobosum LB1 TaxID=1410327 RepID=UPI000644906D|nr:hypothetical protein SAMD00019534_040230 [Acytostelium subglobosum LB1]GAM20848.1 hypothetical protein SAMD00019534_040230 [Acytostelium subglobosum LB1]|eukprot:XP_012755982.1 hypothetical protein SAMD00019534_040230 [Acytostelium subglobosum LB1]
MDPVVGSSSGSSSGSDGCTLSQDQITAAGAVNLAASCLSILGSSAIIINYFFFLRETKRQQVLYQMVLSLSIADFFGSIAICISQSVVLSSIFQGIVFCVTIRAFINFFFLASFMWMCCIAFHAFWSSRQRSQVPLPVFHIVSWTVPAVMTTIMLGKHMIVEEHNTGYCHPTPQARWAFWYGPMFFTFAWNIILYGLILWRYRQAVRPFVASPNGSRNVQDTTLNNSFSQGSYGPASERFVNERKRKLHSKVARQLGIYLLAFLICWLPDLVDSFVSTPAKYCDLYWLWILQNFTTPLQGFLNFIVYGVSSRMFLRCCRSEPLDIRSIHENRSQKISILRGIVD